MALGEVKSQRFYLTITEGKLLHKENGKRTYYGYVEGSLEHIYKQDRVFNGESVPLWYIDISGERGEIYALSFPLRSGVFKSIVLSLAAEPDIAVSRIRIEPYYSGGFSKVIVSSNGKRLEWITNELPPVESVSVNGLVVKDDSKRMEYISSLVDGINGLLGY